MQKYQYIFGSIFTNIVRYVLKIELDLPYAILHIWSGKCIALICFVFKLFWIQHKKAIECTLVFPEYLWGDTMKGNCGHSPHVSLIFC